MARMRGIAAPAVRLPAAGLPRVALPACGWRLPRPASAAGGIGAAVMDALVLWYDPRRQGATNASMAADPRLVDLSGNGHDAACRNFAWAGMSGIGGYTDNLFDVESNFRKGYANLVSPETLHITKANSSSYGLGYWKSASMTPRLILEVEGIGEDIAMYVSQYNADNYWAVRVADGINDVQLDLTGSEKPDYPYLTFFFSQHNVAVDITVRILPLYPGALVADGVDDWCEAAGLPALGDFTVVAERQLGTFHNAGLAARQGVFSFEQNNSGQPSATAPQTAQSFGATTFVPSGEVPAGRAVSWMTPTSYNGMGITRGDGADDGAAALWLFKRDASANRLAAALWSFLLFDRTLTGDEIEWVKDNLMGDP